MQDKRVVLGKYRRLFESTFPMKLTDFMHPILGFDLVKFIDQIGCPDNVSAEDCIKEKYDDAAVALIRRLIDAR